MRDGRERRVKVTVGELEAPEGERPASKQGEPGAVGRLGLRVEPLSDEMKSRWEVSQGVVVALVESGSPAAMAKLQVGDVLTLVDGQSVSSVAAFDRVVKALPSGKMVALRIVRRGRAGFVAVEAP